MIYEALIGSRSYGLNIRASDMDVGVIYVTGLKIINSSQRKIHPLCESVDSFINFFDSGYQRWARTQWLFPARFYTQNDLSDWIVKNREDLIKALLPEVYDDFMTWAKHKYTNKLKWSKSDMYSIHLTNILYKYAEGMSFEDAIRPQGEEKEFLLAVRKAEVPRKKVYEEKEKAEARAISVADFYKEPLFNTSIIDEFKDTIRQEAKNYLAQKEIK